MQQREAIDKTAGELFSDAKANFLLAYYCCIFAIVKAVRNAYTGIRTFVQSRVWMVHDCVVGVYRRRQREAFICWSTLGWSLSASLFALQLYTT